MTVSSWRVAAACEYCVAGIALFVMMIVALVAVPRRYDPLRRPFLWLKLSIAFFAIYVAISEASQALIIAIQALGYDYYYYYDDTFPILNDTVWRLGDIGPFFSSITDILILLCIVELGLSMLRAFGYDGVHRNIIRYSNFVAILALFGLAVGAFAADEDWITKSDYGSIYRSWTTISNLYSGYSILLWITAVFLLFFSSFVLYSSMQKKQMGYIAGCFLATCLFNLTRTTWEFSYVILYYIENPDIEAPEYVIVVDPILYTWFTVIMFGLLIAIGAKKSDGLWSPQYQPNQQVFMASIGGGAGLGAGQGYVAPPAPTYMVYQPQPVQTGIINSTSPIQGQNQQYQWNQYPQPQSPVAPGQTRDSVFVQTPVELGQSQRGIPSGMTGGVELPTNRQPEVTQLYEVAGTRDQKS